MAFERCVKYGGCPFNLTPSLLRNLLKVWRDHRSENGYKYISSTEVGEVVGGLGVSEEELDVLMCNFLFS